MIKTNIESYIKPDENPMSRSASIPQPAHKPFIPSIILKAFIIPTTQKIVNGIENIPKLRSPKPNIFPRFSICTPVIIIIYVDKRICIDSLLNAVRDLKSSIKNKTTKIIEDQIKC